MLSRTTLTLAFAALSGITTTQAANLIINGTFESGSTAGWTVSAAPSADTTGSCNDTFAAQTSASGCKTGLNPISGSYAAYTSSSFPNINNNVGEWDNYLSQSFVVPTGVTSGILTWQDASVWSCSGTFCGADTEVALKVGSTYISAQDPLTNPGSSGSLPWTNESWDVTSILQNYSGQTLTLEIGVFTFFDSRGGTGAYATALNAGFDNVALNVNSAASTPEPATLGLTGIALVGLGFARRRARR